MILEDGCGRTGIVFNLGHFAKLIALRSWGVVLDNMDFYYGRSLNRGYTLLTPNVQFTGQCG